MAEQNSPLNKVYNDTVYFIDGIMKSYDAFPPILNMMKEGKTSVELRKRYMLRAIDETWVNAVEDTLPALDAAIRTPSKFLEELEEVLPIELTKSISSRSLQHLCQHTNNILSIEGDEVTPSKLLNVRREETMMTYENKFINTLINRLYIFVNRRYEIALKDGKDEKNTALNFEQEFKHDGIKGKIHFGVEISEDAGDDVIEKNGTYVTKLWHRVEKLNGVISAYASSDFVKQMGKNYIHPPIMHTNAIMKNKNLHQCLELWQFIEGYDEAGYSMLVQENLENIDEHFIKELYSTVALQYMIFRYNIHNEFEADNTLSEHISDDVFNPKIVSEFENEDVSEFDLRLPEKKPEMPSATRYGTLTSEDKLILQAIQIALKAEELRGTMNDVLYDVPADIPEPEPVAETEIYEPAPEPEKPKIKVNKDTKTALKDHGKTKTKTKNKGTDKNENKEKVKKTKKLKLSDKSSVPAEKTIPKIRSIKLKNPPPEDITNSNSIEVSDNVEHKKIKIKKTNITTVKPVATKPITENTNAKPNASTNKQTIVHKFKCKVRSEN